MAWHAKYGRRRKLGRVVVKAMAAFMYAGGQFSDFNRLSLAASGFPFGGDEADTIGAEVGDITTELLRDVLSLTHPDHHPAGRRDLATRVTSELLSLQPFVFPAPKAVPPPAPPEQSNDSLQSSAAPLAEALRAGGYPCADCIETVPYFYCTSCRAEWDKRQRVELERENAKQRAQYRRRRQRRQAMAKRNPCAACGASMESRRAGAVYCSPTCRQKGFRSRAQLASRQ